MTTYDKFPKVIYAFSNDFDIFERITFQILIIRMYLYTIRMIRHDIRLYYDHFRKRDALTMGRFFLDFSCMCERLRFLL